MDDDWDSYDWEMNAREPSEDDDCEVSSAVDQLPFNGEVEAWGQRAPLLGRGIPDLLRAKQYAERTSNGPQDHAVFQYRDNGWFIRKEHSVPEDVDVDKLPSANYLGLQGGLELIEALRDSDRSNAEALISQGVDVNATDRRGVSPLMVAAYRGYGDICQKLINLGAKIDEMICESGINEDETEGNTVFDTPLARARASRDSETIDVLEKAWIRHKWKTASKALLSDSSASPNDYGDLFVQAAEHGLTTLCVEMIALGLDINHESVSGTALRCSLDSNDLQTTFVLIALGAKVDDLYDMIKPSSELYKTIQSMHALLSSSKQPLTFTLGRPPAK